MTRDDGPEVGERIVERLGEHGVEYVFSTFGTDHPTLIKGMTREGTPDPVLAPHEMVAASAAHGYAQASGRPGVVLVHVDVGTANLGAALHNANRSRVPLFVAAGRTPRTTDGEKPGSRSIFVHWYQDVFDQHGLVREYTKWEYELETAANAERVVDRGLEVATANPAGPVYLTLPREILREGAPPPSQLSQPEYEPATLDAATRDDLVDRLAEADYPLVITSYLGRDERAVETLETFAETTGAGVVEAAPAFDLNFPREHPLHFGFATEPHFEEADLLLVLDCDVPWVPKRGTPRSDATVVHVDSDPGKGRYPNWGYDVDVSVRADARSVLSDLAAAFDADADDRRERLRERGASLQVERRGSVPDPSAADAITPELLSATLGEVLDGDGVVVDETVTNTPAVLEHCTRTDPGSYYSYCSSGLGWGLGAALGVSLARPDETVVCVVGDGSFVLGNPVAAVQMAQAYDRPHLTVIYDNDGWAAVADAIADQYAEAGFDPDPFTQFSPGTDYAAVADGLDCHGERVSDPGNLEGAIRRGLEAVEDGTHAILDVVLAPG